MVAEDKKVMVCHKRCEISHRAVFFFILGGKYINMCLIFCCFSFFFLGGKGGLDAGLVNEAWQVGRQIRERVVIENVVANR